MKKKLELLVGICSVAIILEAIMLTMMWVLEVGNVNKMSIVIISTSVVQLIFRAISLFIPKERLGIGPKGIINRIKNKKRFHPSWKDLFDHH